MPKVSNVLACLKMWVRPGKCEKLKWECSPTGRPAKLLDKPWASKTGLPSLTHGPTRFATLKKTFGLNGTLRRSITKDLAAKEFSVVINVHYNCWNNADVNVDDGKVVFVPWVETDFRTGEDPWWA
ncbi:hypothetical protein PanWU01x14_000870 [Parasponia andersonii]|uniref:Uncharacterized protein n=1 Tax=Parasponia andersonii TaxID=3476 RepID=A0A2P5E4T1_PARAD|nr:hypothetical protein PanWU01x14_000870 [Parasponia andersonii]